MVTRKIIEINEDLCNGCGDCIVGCAEGALQLVNGKAKIVKDNYCDGFGDCVGSCPTGALKIIERESEVFDINAVKEHLHKTQGALAVQKMEEAHKRHEQCTSHGSNRSELAQWPVQIHLVSPKAAFFNNRELVVMNSCGAIASADVHGSYLRGRSVVIGCPKLDKTEPYANKIAEIVLQNSVPKVIIVRMEVPCCGGLTHIVLKAREEILSVNPEKASTHFEEHTLSLQGELLSVRRL